MTTRLNPYLSFTDTALAAMEFYRDVFGGELALNTFGEFGDPDAPGADLVMHSILETPGGLVLMAGDAPQGTQRVPPPAGISVSLSGDDADQLRRYWARLSEDGTVSMPLERQLWGDEFGMCTDMYGIPWMVNITAADA
jgi:PhnB protein